jgi:MFS family permease
MFGSSVFLSQFFQLARGASATEAGLLTLPMIAGLFLASTIVGQLISRYGRWKPYLVGGGISLVVGLLLQGSIMGADTPYWELAVSMALVGIGVGATQQNLVLAVQNQVALRDMGARSAAPRVSPRSVRCSRARSRRRSPRASPRSASRPRRRHRRAVRFPTWRRSRSRSAWSSRTPTATRWRTCSWWPRRWR